MSDWQELDDPGTGRKYYFNATTNTTQWDPPAGFGAPAAVASNWQELTDPGSGRTYYFNATTNTTQWDIPAELAGAGGGAAAKTGEEPASTKASVAGRKSMLTRRSTIAKRSTVKPQTVSEKLAARAKKFVQMRKAEKLKTQPSAFARKRAGGGGAAAGLASPSSKVAAAAAPSPAPAVAADSPWQPVQHPETGQTYYYNATTGETAWTVPA